MGLLSAEYGITFLMSVSTVMVMVALPYLAIDWFKAGPALLGLLGGVSSICYVGTCFLSGPLLRTFGQKGLMVSGVLGCLVVAVTLGSAPGVWYLLLMSALTGFGTALFWPALETRIGAGVGPAELRHRMGWFNLSWSSADVLGTLAGGGFYTLAHYLVQYTGHRGWRPLPFYLAAVVELPVLLMLLRAPRPGPSAALTAPDRQEAAGPRNSAGNGAVLLLGVFWVMALLANSTATAFRAVLINVFPDIGKDFFHYSGLQWGILLAMTPLVRTVMFAWWWRHRNWTYRAGYFFGLQALLPLAALMIVFGSSYGLFLVAFSLVGVGISMTYYSSIYYSLDSETAGHGSRAGLHEAILGMGGVMGPPLAGWFAWASGNIRAPYYLIFAILGFSMATQLLLYVARRMGLQFFRPRVPPAG